MTKLWKICARPDPRLPKLRQGFALAETEQEALQLAQYPNAMVFEYPDKAWPGPNNQRVMWNAQMSEGTH